MIFSIFVCWIPNLINKALFYFIIRQYTYPLPPMIFTTKHYHDMIFFTAIWIYVIRLYKGGFSLFSSMFHPFYFLPFQLNKGSPDIESFEELCNRCNKNFISKALLYTQRAVMLGTEQTPSAEQKRLLEVS